MSATPPTDYEGNPIAADHVRDCVTDLVSNFLYYDRKEDEQLPRGAIQDMIECGMLTKEQIVQWFADELGKTLK